MVQPKPTPPFAYKIIEGKKMKDLAERINQAARDGWEPINAYSVGGSNVGAAHHYALLRQPST